MSDKKSKSDQRAEAGDLRPADEAPPPAADADVSTEQAGPPPGWTPSATPSFAGATMFGGPSSDSSSGFKLPPVSYTHLTLPTILLV